MGEKKTNTHTKYDNENVLAKHSIYLKSKSKEKNVNKCLSKFLFVIIITKQLFFVRLFVCAEFFVYSIPHLFDSLLMECNRLSVDSVEVQLLF